MSTKNKLDKVAYVLLNIAAIIVLILVVGIVGFSIYTAVCAVSDTLAGGWILFLMGLLGIFLCPMIVGWIVQDILHLLGWIQYRKNNMTAARIFGVISSFTSITNSLVLMVLGMMIYGGEEGPVEILAVLTIVPGICIIYMAIPFVLLIVSMCKKKVVA